MGKQQLRAELIPESLSVSDDHMSVFIRGGYTGPPTWNKYVQSHAKDLHPFLQEIRNCVLREGLLGAPASEYAIKCRFEFINGEQFAFDHKGWAEFQAALGAKPEKPTKIILAWSGIFLFVVFVIYLLVGR
jgi:hypothetical protein